MSSTGTIFDTTPLLPWRPGHLVARLQAALDRDVHLDHLLHARRQLVALRQLALLLLEHLVELDAELRERVLHRLELARRVLAGEADVEPVVAAATLSRYSLVIFVPLAMRFGRR